MDTSNEDDVTVYSRLFPTRGFFFIAQGVHARPWGELPAQPRQEQEEEQEEEEESDEQQQRERGPQEPRPEEEQTLRWRAFKYLRTWGIERSMVVLLAEK